MLKASNRLYISIFFLFSIFIVFCFLHLAQACYFADSEIWLLTLSQHIFSAQHISAIAYKSGFHVLTYIFSHHAPSEVDVYYYARWGWSLTGVLAALGLAYFYALSIKKPKYILPLFISIMTFSAFFNQGFRIRGDILALFVFTCTLLFFTYLERQRIHKIHYLILLSLNTLMLTATPKSIYFFIPQFLFAIQIYKSQKRTKSFAKLIWIVHLAPLTLMLFLAIASYFFPKPLSLITSLHEIADYYLKAFDNGLKNFEYLSTHDFVHIFKAFVMSPTHLILFLSGLLLYIYSSYHKNSSLPSPSPFSPLNVLFGSLLLALFFHNEKLPFFIGIFGAPLIAHATLLLFVFIEKIIPKYFNTFALLIASSQVFWAGLQYQNNLQYNHNLSQTLEIQNIENYFQRYPRSTHFDIIGLLPRKTTHFLFIGPGETTRKKQFLSQLQQYNPDVILFVYKFIYLEPDIVSYLTTHYISPEPHIWVKGDFFSLKHTPTYFQKTQNFNQQPYWIIPHTPKAFIYSEEELLRQEVIYLLNGKPVTDRLKANQFAVPKKHLSFTQTNTPPLALFTNPFLLFRYDTQF